MKRLLLPEPTFYRDSMCDPEDLRANQTKLTIEGWRDWCVKLDGATYELRAAAHGATANAILAVRSAEAIPREGLRLPLHQHHADVYFAQMLKLIGTINDLKRQIRT